jgi:hypothetical protein
MKLDYRVVVPFRINWLRKSGSVSVSRKTPIAPKKGKTEEILCFEELVVVSGVLEAVNEKIFTVVKHIF